MFFIISSIFNSDSHEDVCECHFFLFTSELYEMFVPFFATDMLSARFSFLFISILSCFSDFSDIVFCFFMKGISFCCCCCCYIRMLFNIAEIWQSYSWIYLFSWIFIFGWLVGILFPENGVIVFWFYY